MTSAPFPSDDFLLDTDVAADLYHRVARPLPIVDYHCHLPPPQLASNHRFRSITELWLAGDHYKWRAMRACGEPERLCTGDASDWEKFEAWARTVPQMFQNPLHHWTAMELRRPFGITVPLSPATARGVFEQCNTCLGDPAFRPLGLLSGFRVAVVCTTDDPTETLDAHQTLAARPDPETRVYPTWRPDRALAVADVPAWNRWVDRLEEVSNRSIGSWTAFMDALTARHSAFHQLGCRASDHGLERLPAVAFTDQRAAAVFDALRAGRAVDDDADVFRAALLHHLALLDHARRWVQQFHLGAMRNTRARLLRQTGSDAGADSIGDFGQGSGLAAFLDRLDDTDQLAKTILYNLNPADNALFATMIGNFQDGSVPGKMQWGAAWWFLDQLDGMEAQIRMLGTMGILSRFVGMVTDSRSFLSYSRHDYFRRLVCHILGEDVRRGRLPNDRLALGCLVENVAYFNAVEYFGFPLGRCGVGAARQAHSAS